MPTEKSESQYLAEYDVHRYETPLTTVDIVIFTIKDSRLCVLLVKRSQHPFQGMWALPGGFIDIHHDQTLVETAKRKLLEKTGVATPYLEQLESYGSAGRDPRGWSVTVVYLALLPWETIASNQSSPTEEVQWLPIDEREQCQNLAFDHAHILDASVRRLQGRVFYTSLPINLLPAEFTLSELQKVYELILGKTLEKKSFRRRILDADILAETGNLKTGGARPAKRYQAKPAGEKHIFPRVLEGTRN